MYTLDVYRNRHSFLDQFWRWWVPASSRVLRDIEEVILNHVVAQRRCFHVDIGGVVERLDKIWTVCLNEDLDEVPLLLLHGNRLALAFWVFNFDSLAMHRPVYAIDLLGFGRSSRPVFGEWAIDIEDQLVKSVEEWRKEMKLDTFIILGHDIGGYIATAYAMRYPYRVVGVILADPWGFSEVNTKEKQLTIWSRVKSFFSFTTSPTFLSRLAGPFGHYFMESSYRDLLGKFAEELQIDKKLILQYVYQCNIQAPTGERALDRLSKVGGQAMSPMIKRLSYLKDRIPVTYLYSQNSASQTITAFSVSSSGLRTVLLQIKAVPGESRYIFANELFNKYVNESCDQAVKLFMINCCE